MPDVSNGTEIDCKYARKINYPSSNDCQSYYKCINSYGAPTILYCADNLQFNPILQKCDFKENVVNIRPKCSSSINYETTKISSAQVGSKTMLQRNI